MPRPSGDLRWWLPRTSWSSRAIHPSSSCAYQLWRFCLNTQIDSQLSLSQAFIVCEDHCDKVAALETAAGPLFAVPPFAFAAPPVPVPPLALPAPVWLAIPVPPTAGLSFRAAAAVPGRFVT